jgi:alkaline phosphatase D
MSGAADVALTQSDEGSKPPLKVAGVSARQAAAGLVALVLAFLAGKWSAGGSSPAPAPPPAPLAAPDPHDAQQGSAASPQPTAWAALPPASSTLTKLAFGSCADQKYPAPFWDTIAQLGPDLFIYGGDNVYGDCTGDCAGSGRCDCSTLSAAYDGLRSHPSFLGTKGRLPMVAIWDDHDYGWNDAGAEFVKRDEAKQLFLDFYSVPQSDARRSREGLYTSYSYGPPDQRVQIILLDQR